MSIIIKPKTKIKKFEGIFAKFPRRKNKKLIENPPLFIFIFPLDEEKL
jgi:hypothetical protein